MAAIPTTNIYLSTVCRMHGAVAPPYSLKSVAGSTKFSGVTVPSTNVNMKRFAGATAVGSISSIITGLTAVPAVVYSVRKVITEYTGNAMLVRHGTNNAQATVAFDGATGSVTANSLVVVTSVGTSAWALNQTMAFSAFYANSASIYVVTWYDQAGSNLHATQATAANQPLIVANGTLITKNGVATVFFNSTSSTKVYLASPNTGTSMFSTAFSMVALAGVNANMTYNALVAHTSGALGYPWDVYSNKFLVGNNYQNITMTTGFDAATGFNVWTYMANTTQATAYYAGGANGSLTAAAATMSYNIANVPVYLGTRADLVTSFNGWMAEVVLYSNLQISRADQIIIENSQGLFYRLPSGQVMWTTTVRGTGLERANGIAALTDGTFAIAGQYASTTTLYNADGTSFATTLAPVAGADAFVARYSAAGKVLWVARVTGSGTDTGQKIAQTTDGGLILAGNMTSSITVYNADGTTFGTLSNATAASVFLVKYSASGTAQWTARVTGASLMSAIATKDGAIAVAGQITSPLTAYNADTTKFGTSITLTAGDPGNGYIVKYTNAGSVLWRAHLGSSTTGNYDDVRWIASLSDGSIAATGSTPNVGASTTVVAYNANDTAFATTIATTGQNDPYVVMYSPSGTVQWLAKYGATSYDAGQNVAVLADDSIVVAATVYSSPVTPYNADGTPFGATYTGKGAADTSLVRYTAAGYVQSIFGLGGTGNELSIGMCSTSTGGFAVTGTYSSALTASSAPTGATATVSLPYDGTGGDFYVAVYDATCTARWMARVKGAGDDQGTAICCLTDGSLVATGIYTSAPASVFHASGVLHSSLANSGNYDGFIVRYTNVDPPASSQSTAIARDGLRLWLDVSEPASYNSATAPGLLTDMSGTGNDFTLSSSSAGFTHTAYSPATAASGYLSIDSIFASGPPSDKFGITTDHTVEVYAEPQVLYNCLFEALGTGGERMLNFHLVWPTNEVIYDTRWNAAATSQNRLAYTPTSPNTALRHYTFRTRAGTSPYMTIHENGVQKAARTAAITANGAWGGTTRLFNFAASGNQWKGKFYMMRVYNRALSDAEILQNYNAVKARYFRNKAIFTGLAACYSVRLANDDYTGPVIKVRRSSDNALSDFYADTQQTYLTTGANNTGTTFASWIGASTAYVTTWYDQSGNNNNSTNTTNSVSQPTIALQYGKYVVNFNAANSTLLTIGSPIRPNTIVAQWYNSNTTTGTIVTTQYDYEMRFYIPTGKTVDFSIGNAGDWYYMAGKTKFAYVNGVSSTIMSLNEWNTMAMSSTSPNWANSQTSNVPSSFNRIGTDGWGPSRGLTGYMAEIMFHNSALSTAIAASYNANCLQLAAYDQLSTTTQASTVALFGMKLLRSAYTGPVLQLRRSSDNTTKDFYASLAGTLSDAAGGTGTTPTTWLGAATGFVTTWYDQSGGGYHLTQATAARQPTLSNTSNVITFNGSTQYLEVAYTAALNTAAYSYILGCTMTGTTGTYQSPLTSRSGGPSGNSTAGYIVYLSSANVFEHWAGAGLAYGAWTTYNTAVTAVANTRSKVAARVASNALKSTVNGTSGTSATFTYAANTTMPLRLGAGVSESPTASFYWNGTIDTFAYFNQSIPDADNTLFLSAM
jgi:Alpha-L-arabinofuranosidase B, catalytic/Concanavalin A-like lectin/glucanases superfamily